LFRPSLMQNGYQALLAEQIDRGVVLTTHPIQYRG